MFEEVYFLLFSRGEVGLREVGQKKAKRGELLFSLFGKIEQLHPARPQTISRNNEVF